MSEWDFFDVDVLKKECKTDQTATRAGFQVYDHANKTIIPAYYGIIITTEEVQREMFNDGINGGYSLIKKKTKVGNIATTVLRTEEDYEKACNYTHYARAIYPIKKNKKAAYTSFRLEYPEIEKVSENDKFLLTIMKRGASIEDIAGYLDKHPDEIVRIAVNLSKDK